MGKDVKDQTNLVRRGRIYYLRGRIPADLKEHYGKAEIWRSLRTAEKSEALQLVRLERVKLDQEFHHARAVLGAPPVAELSAVEIDRLAAMWYAQLLEEDEEARIEGLSGRELCKQAESLNWCIPDAADLLASGGAADVEFIDFEMGDFLASHGYRVQRGADSWNRLAYAFAKAWRRALDALAARHRGEVVDTPNVEPAVIRGLPQRGDTLEALLDYWKAQGSPRERTVQEIETLIRVFSGLEPGLPASKIEKRHVVALKDRLLQTDAPATVRKKMGLLKAVLQVAADNEKLPTNPAAGVKVSVPKVKQKARVPFDSADLTAIFASEVFTKGARPAGGAGEAAYWLPLLALFTGARLEELGQLLASDVKEAGGVRYLDITNDPESDKTIKTSSSRRRVPIHPELIHLGFLAYVDGIKEAPRGGRLFPLLKSGKGRQLTASWSKWYGRYLRGVVKIEDGRKVFAAGVFSQCPASGEVERRGAGFPGRPPSSVPPHGSC